MPRKLIQLIVVGLFCLLAGIALGHNRDSQGGPLEGKVTLNSIPRAYGHLVAVDRSSQGPVLYFEGDDGTIRIVAANYGVNYGTLNFRAVAVPRD